MLAIHQPNYLPWAGFFFKAWAADTFVLLDDVPLSRRSYTRRTRIRKAKNSPDWCWLSIPLKHAPTDTPIRNVEIHHDGRWPRKHFRKLRNAYAGTPHWEALAPLLDSWFARAGEFPRLADWNCFLLRNICNLLGRCPRFVWATELGIPEGEKNERNRAFVQRLGEKHYLSGSGARNYQDTDPFESAGIQVLDSDFFAYMERNPYPEQAPFLNGLSILDALMYLGVGGVKRLFSRRLQEMQNANRK